MERFVIIGAGAAGIAAAQTLAVVEDLYRPYKQKRRTRASIARERGLDGCYACPELDGCGKGYFGAEDGHTAKDAARSIRERGKEAHAQGLNEAREG